MKIWKHIAPNEVVSVGELYKRVYGESGMYYQYEDFFNAIVRRCKKFQIIPLTASQPYRVTREKSFSEKVLDLFKSL